MADLRKNKDPQDRKLDAPFEPVNLGLECVLFMRTRAPVEPVSLAKEIAADAAAIGSRKRWHSRFIHKITPISYLGRANVTGVEEVAKKVLSGSFQLVGEEEGEEEVKECTVRMPLTPGFQIVATVTGI